MICQTLTYCNIHVIVIQSTTVQVRSHETTSCYSNVCRLYCIYCWRRMGRIQSLPCRGGSCSYKNEWFRVCACIVVGLQVHPAHPSTHSLDFRLLAAVGWLYCRHSSGSLARY